MNLFFLILPLCLPLLLIVALAISRKLRVRKRMGRVLKFVKADNGYKRTKRRKAA